MRGRAVGIGRRNIARRDDPVSDLFAVEIVHGQARARIAHAGGHQGAIDEVRQDAHRHLAAAYLRDARRDGFTDRVDQVGAHGIPGVHEQVDRQRSITAAQSESPHLDSTNAPAAFAEARMHGVCRREQFGCFFLDARRCGIDVGDRRHVDLPGQQ